MCTSKYTSKYVLYKDFGGFHRHAHLNDSKIIYVIKCIGHPLFVHAAYICREKTLEWHAGLSALERNEWSPAIIRKTHLAAAI